MLKMLIAYNHLYYNIREGTVQSMKVTKKQLDYSVIDNELCRVNRQHKLFAAKNSLLAPPTGHTLI